MTVLQTNFFCVICRSNIRYSPPGAPAKLCEECKAQKRKLVQRKKDTPIYCNQCGISFLRQTTTQVRCHKCNNPAAANKRRTQRYLLERSMCLECQEPIPPELNTGKKLSVFCSVTCQTIWASAQPIELCVHCGVNRQHIRLGQIPLSVHMNSCEPCYTGWKQSRPIAESTVTAQHAYETSIMTANIPGKVKFSDLDEIYTRRTPMVLAATTLTMAPFHEEVIQEIAILRKLFRYYSTDTEIMWEFMLTRLIENKPIIPEPSDIQAMMVEHSRKMKKDHREARAEIEMAQRQFKADTGHYRKGYEYLETKGHRPPLSQLRHCLMFLRRYMPAFVTDIWLDTLYADYAKAKFNKINMLNARHTQEELSDDNIGTSGQLFFDAMEEEFLRVLTELKTQ